MSAASFGKRLLAQCKNLLVNPFFWAGAGILFFLALALYVTVDKIVMPNYTRHGVSVTVPDVRNEPADTAREELQALGFRVEEQDGQYNPALPRNVVLDQSPNPDTPLKPNRRVYLTLNQGEVPTVVLPDNLVSLARRVARSRLQELRLNVEMRQDSIPAADEGTITRHSPGPGDTVQVGSTVTLWYSAGLGTEEVTVPSVIGRSLVDARRALERAQLWPVVISGSNSGFCSGDASSESTVAASPDARAENEARLFVCYQGTAADTQIRAGSKVRLGVTRDSTAVPDSVRTSGSSVPAGNTLPDTSATSVSSW